MRELSQRRMKRWLERRCARYQRRRYGLAPHRIPAPESAYGAEWLAGERVPAVRPLGGRFAALVPYPMSIARIGPGYPWSYLVNNRMSVHELNANARLDLTHKMRAKNRRARLEEVKHEARAYGRALARGRVTTIGGL